MSPVGGDKVGLHLSAKGSSDGYSGKPLFTIPHPTLSSAIIAGYAPAVHANAGHKKSAYRGGMYRLLHSSTQRI